MRKGSGIFVFLMLWGAQAVAAEPPVVMAAEPLVVGVTPQQSAGRLAENWVPLLEEVAKRFGTPLTFRTAPGTQEFERRVLAGEYDLVYGSPVLYVAAAQAIGARAIARQRHDEQGVLVVRADSAITELGQLHGRTVAFPAASAFGGTILTQAVLKRHGVVVDGKALSSDESVYRAVLDGAVDGGGGALRTLERQDAETRAGLRPLTVTEAFPAYPFFVLPRLGQGRTGHLQAVLFSLDGDATGRGALERAALPGLTLADDSTYDPVREWVGDAVKAVLRGATP